MRRDRIPAGMVPLPYGPNVCATPARANPAAAAAIPTNSRRENLVTLIPASCHVIFRRGTRRATDTHHSADRFRYTCRRHGERGTCTPDDTRLLNPATPQPQPREWTVRRS